VIDRAKLEAIKVWYAVFTTLMDAHVAGDYTDAELVEKLQQLRARLKELVPDGTPVKPC
jgi:hypothetical protein